MEENVRWSLSEFLNLVELRSQCWCYLTLDGVSGFSIPHNETVSFYAVLAGSAQLSGVSGGTLKLQAGDAVMILSGEAHALRTKTGSRVEALPFLTSNEYADAPPRFSLGAGGAATEILASRLKVRWPGGQHPRVIPAVFKMRIDDGLVNFTRLLSKTNGNGAMAVLTHAANLLFIDAFRDHPECRAAFQEFSLHDPISRVLQYMEMHCSDDWTVEALARKVGMGRSNFAARFTEEIGVSPMTYIAEQRMRKAALILEKTDMKITEISEKVGYKSEAAFIRRFAARFGMTPGEMRKRAREERGRNDELYFETLSDARSGRAHS